MVFCVGAAADYQLTCLDPGWNDFLQYFCSYVYNLQQKFKQNLHLKINFKIYNLQFKRNWMISYFDLKSETFRYF